MAPDIVPVASATFSETSLMPKSLSDKAFKGLVMPNAPSKMLFLNLDTASIIEEKKLVNGVNIAFA